jgi:hypothetical protein
LIVLLSSLTSPSGVTVVAELFFWTFVWGTYVLIFSEKVIYATFGPFVWLFWCFDKILLLISEIFE